MAMQRRADADPEAGIETLTDAEARAVFDRVARRRLGMSGEEFLRRWDAGEFREETERPGVTDLLIILPFVR